MSRWPDIVRKIQQVDWPAGVAKHESISDWQHMYWETHLQKYAPSHDIIYLSIYSLFSISILLTQKTVA